MAFKRKRVFAPRRNIRRKFNKFSKGKRGNRKITSWSTRSSAVNGLQYRSKKIPKRRWNHLLWNSTLFMTHYRSIQCQNNSLSSPASAITVQINRLDAFNPAFAFWTATGGAILNDTGVALPTFRDNIVIRGGRLWLTMTNIDADTTLVDATVILVKTTPTPAWAGLPATAPKGWDVSMMTDFFSEAQARILFIKKILLKPGEAMTTEYRIPIRKIDIGAHLAGGDSWNWIVIMGNSTDASAVAIQEQRGHNLSFAADAVS